MLLNQGFINYVLSLFCRRSLPIIIGNQGDWGRTTSGGEGTNSAIHCPKPSKHGIIKAFGYSP